MILTQSTDRFAIFSEADSQTLLTIRTNHRLSEKDIYLLLLSIME